MRDKVSLWWGKKEEEKQKEKRGLMGCYIGYFGCLLCVLCIILAAFKWWLLLDSCYSNDVIVISIGFYTIWVVVTYIPLLFAWGITGLYANRIGDRIIAGRLRHRGNLNFISCGTMRQPRYTVSRLRVAGIHDSQDIKIISKCFISRLLCTRVTENDWGNRGKGQPRYKTIAIQKLIYN